MRTTNLHTIDLDQLTLVTGGDGDRGRFEQMGRNVGEKAGQLAGPLAPPLVRPLLPPVARELGGQAGRYVDNAVGRLWRPFVR